MANECKVTKVEANVFLEMQNFVLLRRRFGNGDSKLAKSEIVRRACEFVTIGMKPTVDEIKECEEYYAKQVNKRMEKRMRKASTERK